ncbi:MAG TPA: hypothetical protein VFX73_05785, partial [Chitinophagaceae bacterium]|nr:hypothetical protein [Chitinophagaceae bacterium]
FCLLQLAGFSQEPKLTPAMKKAMGAIDTAEYKAHIAYLADDALRGRAPGSMDKERPKWNDGELF